MPVARLLPTLTLLSLAACGLAPAAPEPDDLATVEQRLDVTATYDAARRAPICSSVASGCSSGSLLVGRATKGPEVNTPNTLGATCLDGTVGVFHADESLDALRISTVDGSNLAPGKQVRVEATVWAYSSFTADYLDLYHSLDGSSTWTFIATLQATKVGAHVLSTTFTLPSSASALRAIRGQFRYGGGAGACVAGAFNDRDDLLFTVSGGSAPDAGAAVDAGAEADAGAGADAGAAVDAGSPGPNTIVNAGFEADLTGWSVTGSGATTVSGGRTGMALSLPLSGSLTPVVKQQVQTTGPGTLTLRGYFRNPSSPFPTSQGVTFQVEDVNLVGPGQKYVDCSSMPNSSWTLVTCDASRFAGKLISINLYAANPVLIDDLSLTAVAFGGGSLSLNGGAADQPVVVNDSFESGSTGWSAVGDATFELAGGARTGTGRAVFSASTSAMPSLPGGNAITQALPASATPISVTAYFKLSAAAASSSLTLTVIEADGSSGACGSPSGTTTGWTRASCTFLGSADVRTLRIDGYASTAQALLVDDVTISPLTNPTFDYGLTGWGSGGGVTPETTGGFDTGGAHTALRPTFGNPAGIAQTFVRRSGVNSVGLLHKWESACQACNNSMLVLTLSAPGYAPVTSQLSGPSLVGWYSGGLSVTSFPVGTPVTLTVRADSAVPAGTTTELFRVDAVSLY